MPARLGRERQLRVACGELVHAGGGRDRAVVEADVLRVVDAEGKVGGDPHVLEEDVLGGGFGQPPEQAGAAAGRGGRGDVAEDDVAEHGCELPE